MDDVWFGIETKVRSLMKELLEPTVRRVIENKDSIEKLSKNHEIATSRIDDLDMNIGKYARKIAGIDDFTKRITEFDSSIRMMEVRFNRDREEIKTEINAFNTKIVNFEEYLSVFDHMKEAIRNDITNLTYALQVAKTQNEDKFQVFRDEFRDKLQDLESQVIRFEVKLTNYEKNIKHLGKEIGESSAMIQTAAHVSEEIIKKNKEILKSFKNLKRNAYDNIDKLRLLAIKNMSELQAADKKMMDIIKSELPIRNKIIFHDVLFSVFNDPHQKHSLAQLVKEKFSDIQEIDLPDDVLKEISEMKSRAEDILLLPLPEKQIILNSSDSNSKLQRRKNRQRTVFVVKRDSEPESPLAIESSQRISKVSRKNTENHLEKIEEEESKDAGYHSSDDKKEGDPEDKKN